ncbi:beta-N-acetylhexosaminidase [Pseudoxanthomonas wuyuanensis]|uniref:beta-N-acetylhexosaminidase n=1 Tax=Pseudoxanthomonas wuyuanensis TaxID=1073196 RepID=A0A286CYQ5_9GAMM|nr:family 20 glycosylhydrolase [Pseudoxanthomonas wuyuanensis]KAF1722770.1 beta-hexosaminidase [Pseudoxanthomonas wuyuanensis]SOD51531.1 hexosaminidase [Pseudoxanthomonas wuyuanensis]
MITPPARSTRIGTLVRAFALLVAVLSLPGCAERTAPTAAATSAEALPLIPAPVQAERGEGRFRIAAGTIVSIAPGDEPARDAANHLVRLLRDTRGLDLSVREETTPSPASIRLQLDAQSPVSQTEGYALDADAQGLRIRARDAAGLFYGAISAWQLAGADTGRDGVEGGAIDIPVVTIRDWPRFGWRGQLLDVARHFHDVDTVKHVIDAMAQHKLNVLHLHLTDDQGWRIEIKRYPKLTGIGAWRTPPGAGRHGTPQRYGGYYSQDQIRELVAYAAARHITILPEIDMPGHAQAAVAAYPEEIGVTGERPPVAVDWGVNPYLFDTDERSLAFIRGVLDEVLELFPSPFIHIGGDEAVKDQWEASPAVRAQMQRLGVKDAHAMQGWFNEQLADYLTSKGRRLIGWDEILEGGLPASASVMSWRGVDGAVTAAKLGHDVVLAPAGWMYLDNLQTERSDEPNGRLAVLPLSRVYELDPVPAELTAEQARHVLGAQGALWSEYIPSRRHIDHALFPRLAAVAEVAWSPMAARDWNGFLARLPAQLQRYQALGIGYSDGAFAADIGIDGGAHTALDGGKANIALGNQTGAGQIRYTTDGSEPTLDSLRYQKPFAATLPVTVKAAVFTEDGQPLAATRSRHFDRQTLLSVDTQGLRNCHNGGPLGLRVPLLPDMPGMDTPVYNVDLFYACWTYPQARLDGIAAIRIDAARLARNYGLAHDQSKVHQYPSSLPRGERALGELEVLRGCDGEMLAQMPLPEGSALGEQFELEVPLPPREGVHDLCLRFTAAIDGPLYAIGAVQLIEATAQSPPVQR